MSLREFLRCHRGFDQSRTFYDLISSIIGPRALPLSPLRGCSMQPLKVTRWGMRSKPPQSLLFIFCFAGKYTLLLLGLWFVLRCWVNDLSFAHSSECGGHFSLLRGRGLRVRCLVRRYDCMVLNHIFCVNLGRIYRLLWGTSRVARMPICRRPGPGRRMRLTLSTKNGPARYVGSHIRTRAELAPVFCRISPVECRKTITRVPYR